MWLGYTHKNTHTWRCRERQLGTKYIFGKDVVDLPQLIFAARVDGFSMNTNLDSAGPASLAYLRQRQIMAAL
jgi:hypothetical protein